MRITFPSLPRVSAVALASLGLPMMSGAAQGANAEKAPSDYFGRWTVKEAKPVFTARGR
jgi:hypothetical protein